MVNHNKEQSGTEMFGKKESKEGDVRKKIMDTISFIHSLVLNYEDCKTREDRKGAVEQEKAIIEAQEDLKKILQQWREKGGARDEDLQENLSDVCTAVKEVDIPWNLHDYDEEG